MPDIDGVNLKITADAAPAVKAVEQVTKATEELKETTQNIEVKVDGKMDNLGKLHKANGQFMTMGEKMAEQFNSAFMKKFANIAPALDKAGQKIADVTGKIDSFINKSVIAATAAIGYVMKNALSIGGGFEAQMTNVKIISSATTEELDALIKKAREMGATLPITAKDAAQAMELLAQRGTKAKDILATVADVSALAISQQIDMATSADLLGTTMTNFGLGVEDASKITDIFNNASNQSAMNISKLVAAMKYVGPAAGSLEIPLEKTVALMEAAANAGLTGEMIGTGLSMVFTKIASASSIMGVSTRNLDGSLRDMADIFSDLAKKGMDAGQANTLFGVRAGKTAIALIKNAEQLRQNEVNLQKWGSTQAAVTEKMKTWPNVWNAFKSATEELHIEIFEQIKNQSKEAVSSVANLTRVFSDWVNKSQVAGKSFFAFFQGIGFDALKGLDIRYLLDKIDIDAVAKKFESLGYFFKYTANTFRKVYDWIKTPLQFLIDHLTAFSVINFWTWIAGKGVACATILVSIASGFTKLFAAIKAFTGIDIAMILTHPLTLLGAAAAAAVGSIVYFVNKADEAKQKLREIQREIKQANFEAEYDVQFNMYTGFEELPKSWSKANEETKEALRTQRFLLQEDFINAYERAFDWVKEKYPEYANALSDMGKQANDTILKQLSDFLHGDIRAFQALPDHLKAIAERMHTIAYVPGEHNQEIYRLRDQLSQLRLLRMEAEEEANRDPAEKFSKNISYGIKDMFLNIFTEIDRAKKFLGNENFDFILNVSFSEAKSKLDEFIQTTAKSFNVPQDIVKKAVFTQLQDLADQGHKTAQGIINSLGGATEEINNFMSNVTDYVEYLNVSPSKFSAVFNFIGKGIQKIDAATGKVTEAWKAYYRQTKELTNISFDRFSSRILSMKKAMESGAIDQSALEKEFENALANVSVKVKADMEPTREDYRNERDYYGVFASKVADEMFNLGGDIFGEKLKQKYAGMTGETMGRALVSAVKNDFKGQVIMKVDGVDKLNKFAIDTQQIKDVFNPYAESVKNIDLSTPVQQMSNALNSFGNKLQNINIQVPEQAQMKDYSSVISQIVAEIRTLNASVGAVENAVRAINITVPNGNNETVNIDLSAVISAIQNNSNLSAQIINAINSLSIPGETNTYNIDIQQNGFTIQRKSDADSLARTMTGAIQAGLGNGGV